MKKKINSYDEIKGMLNKIRSFQSNYSTIIKEQTEEEKDIHVINGVDVEIHSEDQMDLELNEDETGQISQLIDDFRKEVSEISDFGTLHIYPNGSKLDGKIDGVDMSFIFSSGDDNGVYINSNLLKINDETLSIINKLKTFEERFSSTLNEILSLRKGN